MLPMPSALNRTKASNLADFRVLLDRVRETFVLGQQKIEELKVQTYWEAGRLIHEHILCHRERADYGKEVVLKLARSLSVGDDLLYRMLRFYEAFPISASRRKLTWSHYRTLSRVTDENARLELEKRAARESWTAEELERNVRLAMSRQPESERDGAYASAKLLDPKKGRPGIYRLVSDGEGLAVDLGFACYQALNRAQARGLNANDFVSFFLDDRLARVADATTADLYTYEAEVVRVVDGDTLWVQVWLKSPLWLKEKLRLRGLDAPEIETDEGRAAKLFVEDQIKKATRVFVTTTKPDKWDRYLSDVFLTLPGGEQVFLNNLLLEQGYAHRLDKVTLGDWDDAL